MNFKIAGEFQWGKIFQGTLEIPMACTLDLTTDYYLIYANLGTLEEELDIGKIFNGAFNVSLPTEVFIVKQAGFFTYSKMSDNQSNSPDRPLSKSFPDAPIPPTVMDGSFPVLQTTSFWVRFDFRTSGLFNTLLEVGYGNESKDCTLCLSGTFASGEEAGTAVSTTTYTAYLGCITLLSLFDFRNLRLQYRLDKSSEYRIQGNISLILLNDSGEGNYFFSGDVHSTEERLIASLKSKNANSEIVNPFGLMKGVTFRNLLFGLVYHYKTKAQKGQGAYRVQGSIAYKSDGSQSEFDFTGQIFLSGNTPRVATMFINEDLDIGAIFNNTFGSAITWPTDFVNLVFHKNSQLYYCSDAEQANKISRYTLELEPSSPPNPDTPIKNPVNYEDGFNLDALFDLTILTTIRNIHGKIEIQGKGVKAAIQLSDKINLWILQLKAPEHTPPAPVNTPKGPYFEFESNQNKMGFNCGLVFFQADFGLNATVTVRKDKTSASNSMALAGSLKFAEKRNNFFKEGAELTFTYDKKNGFKVEGWEAFDFASDAIDYIKEIKKITNKSGAGSCGKLADFAFEQVKNSYRMSPDFITEDEQLFLVLDGTYSVSVDLPGGEINLFDLKFPKLLKFHLPDSVSFYDLDKLIVQALKDAATSFVEAVIKNPDAIATFLVILAGKKAAQYAATMVCRGLVDSNVFTTAVMGGAAALAGAGGLAVGVSAALGAIAVIASITGGGGGGGRPHKSCFIAGTKVPLVDGRVLNIEDVKIGDVLLGINNAHNEVIAFDHPQLGNRTLYRFNKKGDFFVTAEHPFFTEDGWKSIAPSATAAENSGLLVSRLQIGDRLILEDGSLSRLNHIEQKTEEPTTQLYNFKLSGNHSYIANGYFVHNKGGDDTPKQPTLSTICYVNQAITLSWCKVAKAKGYTARIINVKNKILQEQKNLPDSQTSTLFPIKSGLAPGTYLTQVKAVNDKESSDFSSFGILKPFPPALTISFDHSDLAAEEFTLSLSWPFTLATKYYVLHTNQQSKNLSFNLEDYFKDGHYLPIIHDISINDSTPAGKTSYALSLQSNGSYIDSDQSESQVWQRLANVLSFTGGIYLNEPSGKPTLKLDWIGQEGDQDFYLFMEEIREQHTPPSMTYYEYIKENDASFEVELTDTLQISTKIRVLSNYAKSSVPPTNQIPSAWSQSIVFRAPVLLAKEEYQNNIDATVCAKKLIMQYPDITPAQLANPMAKAGYSATETSEGLQKVYPDISAKQLADTLTTVYGKEEETPLSLARQSYAEQLSGTKCAINIINAYPEILPQNMADVMAVSGYSTEQTAQGLKAVYPDISALQLTQILNDAY